MRILLAAIALSLHFFLLAVAPVFAATSGELVNALGLPPEQVVSHEILAGTGDSWPPVWIDTGQVEAAAAFPESSAILLSNGLAVDKGLGSTDWGGDGKRDFVVFSINLSVPDWAKSLVFRTRFTSSEYDPNNTGDIEDTASIQINWTPCNGVGCITAPIDIIKVSSIPDQKSPAILRAIDVALLDTIGISFIISDAANGDNDSAIELMDVHFSEEEVLTTGWISEELPPEDVKMAAGTFRYEKSLLSVPGVGIPLDLRIFYNSKQTRDRTFARKWLHSYEWSIAELENGQTCIQAGDGGAIYFNPDSTLSDASTSHSSSFSSSWKGSAGRIVKNADGSYTYSNREQTSYQFSSAGLLTAITDANGNSLQFSYSNENKLSLIEDTRGGEAAFTYEEGNLVSVTYTDTGNNAHEISMAYATSTETINGTLYEYSDLVSVRDLSGNLTQFTYDEKGNLLTGTDSDGTLLISNTYAGETVVSQQDGNGADDDYSFFVDSLVHSNRLGLNSRTDYDLQDRPIRITDPQGHVVRYVYDEKGNLSSVSDELGNITHMTYDENGSQLSSTDPLGNTTSQTYDSENRITSVTDGAGHTTTYDYDNRGNLLAETNPLGHSLQYDVSDAGQMLATTNRRGKTSYYDYSSRGDLIQETDPLGYEVNFRYNGMGFMTAMTDKRGNTSHYAHDEIGQLLVLTDPMGNETGRTYDARGKMMTLTKANGARTEYAYDPNGNMTELIDPNGNKYSFIYDTMDRQVGLTDPGGRPTDFIYDDSGQLVEAIDAMGGTAAATYDAAGNRIAITDPMGNQTRYGYDALGRVLTEVDPLGNTISNTYDARGLMISSTDARGALIFYGYDEAGRLIETAYPDYNATYSLDENGNRTGSVGKDGAVITTQYDDLDRMIRRTDQYGNTIQYAYDPFGNLIKLTYSDGLAVTYKYDANNRLISVIDWEGNTTSYSYDSIGNLLTTTHLDGSQVLNTYDLAGQLVTTSTIASDGSTLFEANYSYDNAGRLISSSTKLPIEPVMETADDQFSYDGANQIVEMNGQPFSYDANGNLTSGLIDGELKSLQYNERGQLVAAGSDTYAYDDDGLRVLSRIAGKTVRYVQDPNAPYSRLLEEQDESGNVIARYVYGVGLISREDSSGNERIYHYDSRGSTIALTDGTGQITDRFAYDPYGKIAARTGETPNPFTYNGRDGVADDGNGIYFMRTRYYAPALMRFIQKDPSFSGNLMDPQSLNRHTYARGNPVQFVDPEGDLILTTIIVGATIGIATEIALDWATGEFNPLSGDWGTYWEENKAELIFSGVMGAAGPAFAGISRLKYAKTFSKYRNVLKHYEKVRDWKKLKYFEQSVDLVSGAAKWAKRSDWVKFADRTLFIVKDFALSIGKGDLTLDSAKNMGEDIVEGADYVWKNRKKVANRVIKKIKFW